jgi:hypothetical protein
MQRKLTISIDDDVYRGLYAKVGARNISRFLSNLARPYVIQSALDEGYRAMASDTTREGEALEWAELSITDASDA